MSFLLRLTGFIGFKSASVTRDWGRERWTESRAI